MLLTKKLLRIFKILYSVMALHVEIKIKTMSKNLLFAVVLATGLSFCLSSCGDDAVQDVQLNFKMTYGDEPLVMFEDVAFADGRKMQFSRISTYISDVSVSSNGVSQGSTDVDYLMLSDSHLNLEDAQVGTPLKLNIEDGESLDKLTFNLGLTGDQNNTQPTDHMSSSPLSRTGEYWPGWESYIYTKFEGDIDLNNNGEYEPGETFSLHLGTEAALRSVEIDLTDSKESYDVLIDIEKVFSNNGEIYDIDGMRQMHGLSDQTINNINFLADNLSESIGL